MPFTKDIHGVYQTGQESTEASQKLLANWEMLVAVLDPTMWAQNYQIGGTGTKVDPYQVFGNPNFPLGPERAILFGPYHFAIESEAQLSINADGYDGMKLLAFGSTLICTSPTNINTMVSLSGNINQLGNESVEFKGFTLDGNNKVVGDMILWRAMHNSTLDQITVKHGSGTGLALIGCTIPTVRHFLCTKFNMTGQVNTFAHGMRLDGISSTGNSLSTPLVTEFDIAGTQATGITVDMSFGVVFRSGASEACVTGWGFDIGATTSCSNILIESIDTETSGPIYATTGGHQGVHIVRCDTTTIINSECVDSSLVIESTAGPVTVIGSHFFGLFHDSANIFCQINCLGMDPTNGQVFGAGYKRFHLTNTALGVPLFPECTIGRGGQGMHIDQALYGGFTTYAQGNPNPAAWFAMHQDPSGDTQIGGKSLQINTPAKQASYPVASLPTGQAGQTAYATNGRKSGEGVGVGTGTIVNFSNGQWRRASDETTVTA